MAVASSGSMGHNCSALDCFHLDTCHREQRLIIGVRSLNLSLECQMGVMTASGSYLLECLGQHQNQMWTQGLQHQSDQLELSDRDGSQAVGVIPRCFLYKQYVVIWLYSSNMYKEEDCIECSIKDLSTDHSADWLGLSLIDIYLDVLWKNFFSLNCIFAA